MVNQLLNPPHKMEPFGTVIKIQTVNSSVPCSLLVLKLLVRNTKGGGTSFMILDSVDGLGSSESVSVTTTGPDVGCTN
jgi:hypothetical protein